MAEDGGNVFLVVYVPIAAAVGVRDALAAAGAGHIGNYAGCSFSRPGTGRFIPLEGAHPAIGAVGEMVEVAEERIETVVARPRLGAVIRAVKDAHPYEEPNILAIPLLDVKMVETGGTRSGV